MIRRTFLSIAFLAMAATAASAQCDPRFQIVNMTDTPVREIYIDSSALPAYTVDRLGANVLAPGQVFNVTPSQGNVPSRVEIRSAGVAV